MLSEIVPQTEHALARAECGWATSTDLASLIVQKRDLSWRTAHQIAAIVVRLGEERGLGTSDVTSALVDEAAVLYIGQPLELTGVSIREALTASEFVARRTLFGGAAPAAHSETLGKRKATLRQDVDGFTARNAAVEGGRQQLEEAIDRILVGVEE